jgi:3-methyladenine DNA glycosylase Tag
MRRGRGRGEDEKSLHRVLMDQKSASLSFFSSLARETGAGGLAWAVVPAKGKPFTAHLVFFGFSF